MPTQKNESIKATVTYYDYEKETREVISINDFSALMDFLNGFTDSRYISILEKIDLQVYAPERGVYHYNHKFLKG